MQRRADAAGQLHGSDIGQHFRPVRGDHRHAAAHAQALALQRLNQLAGLLAHIAVAGDLVPQVQAGLVVVAVQALYQQMRHQGLLVQYLWVHGFNLGSAIAVCRVKMPQGTAPGNDARDHILLLFAIRLSQFASL